MDFLDNAIEVAKETFQVVSKKTGEIVNTQKQKFDIASLENKRSKDFQKLGEIYYNLIKNSEIEDPKTKALVDAITNKNNEISRINDELTAAANQKVCPACKAKISKNATFCSSCGAKVED